MSFAILVDCKNLLENKQHDQAIKILEKIQESTDVDLERQKSLLMVICCYQIGLYEKGIQVLNTVMNLKHGLKNRNLLFNPLYSESQIYYIAGKSYDKVRNY